MDVGACHLLHQEMGNRVGKEQCLGSCSKPAGRQARRLMTVPFLTLITQSRVSADGSIYKGASVGFIQALELRENKAQ